MYVEIKIYFTCINIGTWRRFRNHWRWKEMINFWGYLKNWKSANQWNEIKWNETELRGNNTTATPRSSGVSFLCKQVWTIVFVQIDIKLDLSREVGLEIKMSYQNRMRSLENNSSSLWLSCVLWWNKFIQVLPASYKDSWFENPPLWDWIKKLFETTRNCFQLNEKLM